MDMELVKKINKLITRNKRSRDISRNLRKRKEIEFKKFLDRNERDVRPTSVKEYQFEVNQFKQGKGPDPGSKAEWEKNRIKEKGAALSDQAAYEHLEAVAYEIDPKVHSIFIEEYERLRKTGLSKNDAVVKVVSDYKTITGRMPPASENTDRVIVHNKTGKRYKSDGNNWIPLR